VHWHDDRSPHPLHGEGATIKGTFVAGVEFIPLHGALVVVSAPGPVRHLVISFENLRTTLVLDVVDRLVAAAEDFLPTGTIMEGVRSCSGSAFQAFGAGDGRYHAFQRPCVAIDRAQPGAFPFADDSVSRRCVVPSLTKACAAGGKADQSEGEKGRADDSWEAHGGMA